MPTEPWVSVEGVAKQLRVGKELMYRLLKQKTMPAHKVGRLWKFELSEVDDWVFRAGGAGSEGPGHPGGDVQG